jgi:hypothetical protein
MSPLLRSEGQGYVTFRLSDVPLALRRKAAIRYSDQLVRELQRDLLDGPVSQAVRAHALAEAALVMREALKPSGRRQFQVPVEEWERKVGPYQTDISGVAA